MIKKIEKIDKNDYITLATEFYNSSAVLHPIPNNHFLSTFDEMMRADTYIEGYLFYFNNSIAGYALITKTFSQEAGGFVLWIEEIYIRPDFQNEGIGSEFFNFIEKVRPKNITRIRLEVEPDNKKAISFYEKFGFKVLDYNQMIKKFN